jgi:ribosome maturation protein Sdo1
MARGNVGNTKVFYQGSSEGFAVFVESEELVKKWKEDKTIPLTEVVAGWKIFTTE